MKRKNTLIVVLLSLVAATTGCKKKNQDQGQDPAAKVAPGSGTPAGSAVAPSAAPAPVAEPAKAEPAAGQRIVEAAKQAGSFTTFLKAVDAAGIAENLNGPGPFTVFAPTDEAFAKVPPKDLEALLADKAKLTQVLQYHVIAGNRSSKDLAGLKAEKSLQGAELTIDASSGVKVAGATVVKPDLAASNGVIHGIDTVLVPPAK
jgi:uncharacterized surface protein with fasciclin (FAS1) repeats